MPGQFSSRLGPKPVEEDCGEIVAGHVSVRTQPWGLVGRRATVRTEPSPARVRVAVQVDDPLSRLGFRHCTANHPDLELVTEENSSDAEVIVVVASSLNSRVMEQMRRTREAGPVKFVLILERFGDCDLLTAIEIGVVALLWRTEIEPGRMVRAVIAAGRGGSELPPDIQSRLIREVVAQQRDVLAPLGLIAAGLHQREIEVLRCLAKGLDTAEVARALNYSESTVKGIVAQLTTRLNLRNRTHAVAFAVRAGIV